MAPNKKPDPFDMKKLMEMSEPINLWLERLNGSTNEGVPLPGLSRERTIDPAATPGSGWTKDDVAKLVPWLAHYWTGAGTYRVQAVDNQNKSLEWEISIPISDGVKSRPAPPLNHPSLVPPGAMQLAPVPMSQAPAPQQQPQQFAGGPNWGQQQFVPSWAPPPPVQQPQQQPQGMQPWQGGQGVWQGQPQQWNPAWGQQPQQQNWGTFGGGMPPGVPQGAPWGQPWQMPPWGQQLYPPSKDDKAAEALEKMRTELEDSKRREIEARHEREREREKAESERKFAALQEEIRRGNETRNGGESDALARERDARERAERDAKETRDRAEREQERQRTDQRFMDLQASIAKIAEIAAGPKNGESDVIREMREDARRRDEEHKRDMEKRDLAARDEKLRLDMAERDRRHEEALRRVAEDGKRGPDPILEMMKESSRTQAENARQMAQMHGAQIAQLSQNSINPLQLVGLMKERDSLSDQFMRNLLPTMTGMLDMFRSSTEQIIGMAGGGPAAAWQPVAEQALQTGKDIMDRYFTWKRDADVSGNKAKIAHADAQASAAQAAARAQEAVATMNRPQAPAPAPAPQPQFTTQSGHVGAPASGPPGAAMTPPAAPAASSSSAPAGTPLGQIIPMKRPPTQEEMFGPGLKSVEDMRRDVAAGKLNPEQCVELILRAVNFLEAENLKRAQAGEPPLIVAAFSVFAEKRWADFADLLLPKAPQPFRDEVVRILSTEIEAVDAKGNPIAGSDGGDPSLKV